MKEWWSEIISPLQLGKLRRGYTQISPKNANFFFLWFFISRYLSLRKGKSFNQLFLFYVINCDFKFPAGICWFGCHSNGNSVVNFSSRFDRVSTAFQAAFDWGHCIQLIWSNIWQRRATLTWSTSRKCEAEWVEQNRDSVYLYELNIRVLYRRKINWEWSVRKREPPTNKKGKENLLLGGRYTKSRDRNGFLAMISKQVHNQVVLVFKIRPTQTAKNHLGHQERNWGIKRLIFPRKVRMKRILSKPGKARDTEWWT